MPVYELEFPTLETAQPMGPEEHSVHLPINKEIADVLELDGRAEVSFTGIVKEISAGYDNSDDNYSLRIDIKKIEVYPENEFTELSKDD